ncbi:hypothetical protein I6N96_10840 [Enterococcus sp. BWM-S5]|uniref:Uncharacterized protein n=1 Tax=Enterococcus larvae TaxID=2794352 RepID=A0ABS4CLC6_9ENTE|nr:DUF6707 family protein [Enterococcus larvae]MBP1046762.1 hypothetical protein [Enterococcus larvae]
MNDLINHIIDTIDKKGVQRNCKKILKKCSFKSSKDLGNITELAVWLYVYEFYDQAISVCDLVKDVPFTGDYTLWGNIDSALCIKARILRLRGRNKDSAEIIRLINEHRSPELYKNLVDWFEKDIDSAIKNNLENNWKADVRQGRLLKLEAAIQYREAGGFPISDKKFEDIIREMVDILAVER